MKTLHVLAIVAAMTILPGWLSARSTKICDELEQHFLAEITSPIFESATIRKLDSDLGSNSEECLNANNSTDPPPCRTLHYTLHGNENSSNLVNLYNIVVHIAPGTYKLDGSVRILNSNRVALLGAGVGKTLFICGTFGEEDRLCAYMNLQIRNSSHVYVSGVTFTQCGPITSIVYVAESDYVIFQDCAFSDNISPPLLLYNTPSVMFANTEFADNRPQLLSQNVTSHICYFSGGHEDTFFIDNRTTSGGISFYVQDQPTSFFVSNCTFRNNSARPDIDVSLPRNSSRYGHGGALNIRLLNSTNSSVCIKESTFEGNEAEAHAGALAISLAGYSNKNNFVIKDCDFVNNFCQIDKCTGGAVGADFFSDTSENVLLFTNALFHGNEAKTGGAICWDTSVASRVFSVGDTDVLILRNCQFEENHAFFEGTALGVFSLIHADQIGVPVEVENCNFVNNSASGGSADTTAVTVYRVLITFQGRNTFFNNSGGGITLLGSRMDVKMGEVLFDGNSAVFGAGLAMSGRSLLLLYSGAKLQFLNNVASEVGGGIYVEQTSADFILAVLNRGCFIQYFSSSNDVPPNEWDAIVEFINNTAGLAGAAIYASDMSRCMWLGNDVNESYFIFQTPPGLNYRSPFNMSNNRVLSPNTGGAIVNEALATDPSIFNAIPEFRVRDSTVSFGEDVSFRLSSLDQLENFRVAVWSVNTTAEQERLGSLSSDDTVFVYSVPRQDQLNRTIPVVDGTANITAEFTLIGTQPVLFDVSLSVDACHPGYMFDDEDQQCVCRDNLRQIVRCDSFNRYFYTKDGLWVGVREDNSLFFSTALPGFLNCTRQGRLPGCLFQFDNSDAQCASGREGPLCGECQDGYGVTFDLRFCRRNCGAGGIILFVFICVLTLVVSMLVLYFDFPIPDELKGVIFFMQVIGVIYRNTPYLLRNQSSTSQFFDFLINFLGFAMPFPVCLREGMPVVAVAFLGFFPPVIATLTAVMYILCANRVRWLSNRTEYGFHGFYFLALFVYKYFLDTSFYFVSCTTLDQDLVFVYQGSQKCFEFPFVLAVVLGNLMLVGLGIILPVYVLYLIYQPKKAIQVANALTHGLKDKRRYRWYGVWDIWRRLLFVAANLFLSFTTRSVVLFLDCVLILISLTVLCAFKPYKKYYINITEAVMILCLLGATLAVLDDNDFYVGIITGTICIAIPYFYGLAFIIYRIGRYAWRKADRKWSLHAKLKRRMKPTKDRVMQHKITVMVMRQAAAQQTEPEGEELHERRNSGEGEAEDDSVEFSSELREPLLEDISQ